MQRQVSRHVNNRGKLIYIHIHTYIHYIYIYICVCVCVCVYVTERKNSNTRNYLIKFYRCYSGRKKSFKGKYTKMLNVNNCRGENEKNEERRMRLREDRDGILLSPFTDKEREECQNWFKIPKTYIRYIFP